MSAIHKNLPTLAMWLAIMSFWACSHPSRFEVRANYRSAENPARQYAIHATGAYPAGADIADAYQGVIVMAHAGANHQLAIKADNFTPRLSGIGSSAHFANAPGQVVDAMLLVQFILAVDVSASRKHVDAEAAELFAVLEAAGMGPKVGLPKTAALMLVSSNYAYQ